MNIALAQCNTTVGDIEGNRRLMEGCLTDAKANQCDLVVFPEMAITGYPPEDLLLKPTFIQDNIAAVKTLARSCRGIAAVVGFVDLQKGQRTNAAAWLESGKIRAIYRKRALPNYGVFDEQRYFQAGTETVVLPFKGRRFGLTICEDIWLGEKTLSPLRKAKPDIVINISASPFHVGKIAQRHRVVARAAKYLQSPVIYCNTVGGQDELIFDGASFVMNQEGRLLEQFTPFEAGLFKWIWSTATLKTKARPEKLSAIEETHAALLLGIRDYVGKNKFEKVTLGLSGGIDSALVATLAVQALGPQRVVGVTMPSRYSSAETHGDAHQLAKNLKIELLDIPIKSLHDEFLATLAPAFKGSQPNIAEENIQARIRGTLLMALSNKFGWLVLTTGNKSEVSTGYCTLYGDTAGGFSVLKDVVKTTVYTLARFINTQTGHDVIPNTTIDRRPTAELRANQFDEDSLGSYDALDPVVVGYVENNQSLQQLSRSLKQDPAYIKRIVSLIDRNEYKRRQAPPGIKITPRSFGRDHRMPITNRYQSH